VNLVTSGSDRNRTSPETGLGGASTRSPLHLWQLEGFFVVAVLGAVFAASGFVILRGAQLSWDEAVYASKARSLATAIPASHWLLYRPPGLPYLGLLAAPFGFSEASLRLVAAAAGVGALAAAWALARELWGALAGVLTVLVLAAAPLVLREIAGFRNDLLSLTPLLLLLLLLWRQLERRDAPNLLLLAAGPLAAATFYLRFGLLPVLGGVAVAALLLWGGRLWQYRRLAGATLLITLALFLPHVLEAVSRTGSPLGIVRAAVAVTDTTGPITSAVTYLRWLPFRIAGPLGIGFVIAAGVAAMSARWASSSRHTPRRVT
jgi:4-amino-4-deoxy-L-arabinose transferase-like glycosyltransferase